MNGVRGIMTVATVGVLALGAAQPARADQSCRWGGRRRDHSRVVFFPGARVILGARPYYRQRECDGPFRGYAIDTTPVALPADHQIIIINGVTYHYYDGVYYKGGPSGYTVVPVPIATGQTASADADLDTLIINVPNANGSYMPVKLQLAKDGTYVGPNGEVYPTKPEIAQLKAMYGR